MGMSVWALKHLNAAGAEEGTINGSIGIQRNLFSIRGSILSGKRGSVKIRYEKKKKQQKQNSVAKGTESIHRLLLPGS